MDAIAEFRKEIASLNINRVQITNKSINNLLENCKSITDLRVSIRNSINNETLEILANKQREIKKLDFTSLTKVSSNSLSNLFEKVNDIHVLYLSFCSNVDNTVIKQISLMNNLKELYISRQDKISDSMIETIT